MTTQEIYAIAETTLQEGFTFETFSVSIWKGQRIYLNRPNQSKKYQDVGYISIQGLQVFPSCGKLPRTERDRDAIKALEAVADALRNHTTK